MEYGVRHSSNQDKPDGFLPDYFMNLFSILGPRFFSILSSASRELYAQSLFTLLDSFSPEEPTLKRETFARKLAESFSSMLAETDFADDDEYLEEPDSDKISFIIRKLRETGWIIISPIENSFSEEIIVPDYAAAIIRVLKNVSERKEIELKGRVYSSYSMLRSAESDEERYLALKGSYENMALFSSELVTIFTNIRGEYQKCLKSDDIQDILSAFLERYQAQIVRRYIEPLSTINSATRYRADIVRILSDWESSDEILEGIAREAAKSEGIDIPDAKNEAYEWISSIISGYESQISLINSIFDRDKKYTQLSTERIKYKARSGMDTKTMLSKLLERSDGSFQDIEDAIFAAGIASADTKSLYERNVSERDMATERAAVDRRAMPEGLGNSFIESLESQISTAEIDQYVLSAIGDEDEIETRDFPMGTVKEFVLFLLATVRAGEKDAPFSMRDISKESPVMPNGIRLPAMAARRR